jgi:hypothetical protein
MKALRPFKMSEAIHPMSQCNIPEDLNLEQCFPNVLLLDPFRLRKITMDPHILAHVNTECLDDDRYPELKICISELI